MWASVPDTFLGKVLAASLATATACLQTPEPHDTSKKAKQQAHAAKRMRSDRQTAFKLVCKEWRQAAGQALFLSCLLYSLREMQTCLDASHARCSDTCLSFCFLSGLVGKSHAHCKVYGRALQLLTRVARIASPGLSWLSSAAHGITNYLCYQFCSILSVFSGVYSIADHATL